MNIIRAQSLKEIIVANSYKSRRSGNVFIRHFDANQPASCVLLGSGRKFGAGLSSQDGLQTAAGPCAIMTWVSFDVGLGH